MEKGEERQREEAKKASEEWRGSRGEERVRDGRAGGDRGMKKTAGERRSEESDRCDESWPRRKRAKGQ